MYFYVSECFCFDRGIEENELHVNALFKINIKNLLKNDQTFSSRHDFTSLLAVYKVLPKLIIVLFL